MRENATGAGRGRPIVAQRLLMWLVLVAAVSLVWFGNVNAASAVEVQFCNYSVASSERCPWPTDSSHPRHSYTMGETRWTGCFPSGQGQGGYRAHVAYVDSIEPNPKYQVWAACNVAATGTTGNTQLLRPY